MDEIVVNRELGFDEALKIVRELKQCTVCIKGKIIDRAVDSPQAKPRDAVEMLETYFDPKYYTIGKEFKGRYVAARDYDKMHYQLDLRLVSSATGNDACSLKINYSAQMDHNARDILLEKMSDKIVQCGMPRETGSTLDTLTEQAAEKVEAAANTKPVKGLRRLLKAAYDALIGKG